MLLPWDTFSGPNIVVVPASEDQARGPLIPLTPEKKLTGRNNFIPGTPTPNYQWCYQTCYVPTHDCGGSPAAVPLDAITYTHTSSSYRSLRDSLDMLVSASNFFPSLIVIAAHTVLHADYTICTASSTVCFFRSRAQLCRLSNAVFAVQLATTPQ